MSQWIPSLMDSFNKLLAVANGEWRVLILKMA